MNNVSIETTIVSNTACNLIVNSDYNVIIAAICTTLALFGLVYTYFGEFN